MKKSTPRVPKVGKPLSFSRRRFLAQALIGAAGFAFAERLSPPMKLSAASQTVFNGNFSSNPIKHGLISPTTYTAYPRGHGPFSGVLVIHDWRGVNDAIKQTADRLAAQDCVAIVPDLFAGKIANSPAEAGTLIEKLEAQRVLEILHNAIDYLAQDSAVSSSKVGIITSNFNSRYAVAIGQQTLQVGGIVVFDALHPLEADAVDEAELGSYHRFAYPINMGRAKPIGGTSVRAWAPMLVLNDQLGKNTLEDQAFVTRWDTQWDRGLSWLHQTTTD